MNCDVSVLFTVLLFKFKKSAKTNHTPPPPAQLTVPGFMSQTSLHSTIVNKTSAPSIAVRQRKLEWVGHSIIRKNTTLHENRYIGLLILVGRVRVRPTKGEELDSVGNSCSRKQFRGMKSCSG